MSRHQAVTLRELEELYREHFHQYLRVAEGITGELQAGLDAVQEGFVKAIRHRSKFRREATLSTWVWRCVVNAAIDVRKPGGVQIDKQDDPIADLRPEGSGAEVRALIAVLPARQRATLFLRYYADLEYEAIAKVLGVEIGTVGAALAKAHATLRREFEEVAE
jgi:RNA polymerase sigma-70 factor, ECF subfamily